MEKLLKRSDMDKRIISTPATIICDCGEFVGIRTDKGFIIGNMLFEFFKCKCPTCGKIRILSSYELPEIYGVTEEGNILWYEE